MTEYPMFKVHMDVEAALAELRTVLESGFVNEGVQVSAFQRAVAEFLGVKQLVLTNSCTSALTLALKLCGVAPGSEVVTTPMTCVATNTPIDNLGGTVVWADIDPETGVDRCRRRRAQAHPGHPGHHVRGLGGTPCDLDALDALARRRGVPLITMPPTRSAPRGEAVRCRSSRTSPATPFRPSSISPVATAEP